jgi:hypothetical protein
MARHAPYLGVGVHLNPAERVPISPVRAIPTLVDRRGRLYLSLGQLWKGIVTRQVFY